MSSGSVKVLTIAITFIIFLLPQHYLNESLQLRVDNIIYSIILIITIMQWFINKNRAFRLKDALLIIAIFMIVILQKNLTGFQLLGMLIANEMVRQKDKVKQSVDQIKIVFFLAITGIVVYSIIYRGYEGRYIFTSIREVNISAMNIFMLGLLLYKYYPYVSYILFGLGLLSFSKSYMLAIASWMILSVWYYRKRNNRITNGERLLNYRNLVIESFVLLVILAFLFERREQAGLISSYVDTGIKRYVSFFDTSNYTRFTVNLNVIKIYWLHPELLLTGIRDEDFLRYSGEVVRRFGGILTRDRPHNFFFSYLQIYGIFSIPIFVYIGVIFKKILNKWNLPVFLAMFTYATFLGMGFNSYYLLFTVILLVVYSGGKDNELSVCL